MNALDPRLRADILLNTSAGTAQRQEKDSLREILSAAFETGAFAAGADCLEPSELHQAAERALIRAQRGEIDAIIVGGGDGTIHTVANVFAGTGIPLGILPLGTLNHFAKDLGIPLALEQAVAVIAQRHAIDVDCGEVNGRLFINNSSIGIYPYMVIGRDRARRDEGLGKWTAMVRSLWRVLRRFPLHRLIVRAGGLGTPFKTPCVFIGNNEYTLALPAAGRRSRLDEGVLCLYVAKAQSRLSLVWLAARALGGFLNAGKDLEVLRETEAEIRSRRRRLAVAFDGEVELIETPLSYRIRPAALKVFAPPAEAPEPSP